METRYWSILHLFDKPLKGKNVVLKDYKIQMPNDIESIVRTDWEKQLNAKLKSLETEKLNLSIRPYLESKSTNPLPALYEGDKPIMWPGPTISLIDVRKLTDSYELDVLQTSFPYINSLSKEEIKKMFEKQNIQLIRPPLAICTFAITSDNQLVLTVRGKRTNMYPGRLYGQGGNPLYTNVDLVEHQEEEMEEEILVKKEDVIPDSLYFAGIVVDKDNLPNKPDLIGWVSLNITSDELIERINKRSPDKRPTDSEGIVFAPSEEKELYDFLTKKTHPLQYCPPANAGLCLYGYYHFGKKWLDNLLEENSSR